MTDVELNELMKKVLAKADRDTLLLIGELHQRLSNEKRKNHR